MNQRHIKQAAAAVRSGGVIAYPTEAVYGLGCCPHDMVAVQRILELKQRAVEKGLIIVAADLQQLAPFLAFPDQASKERALASWPGPTTWIVPADPAVPVWLRGRHSGLAVRVSAHPLVQALCRLAGPLVSTSANPAGHPPAKSSLAVRRYFGAELDYILAGATGRLRQPTAIKDLLTGEVLR